MRECRCSLSFFCLFTDFMLTFNVMYKTHKEFFFFYRISFN